MKTLNPRSPHYLAHSNNIAQIIISAEYPDNAKKLVDLYLEVVNGFTDQSVSAKSGQK